MHELSGSGWLTLVRVQLFENSELWADYQERIKAYLTTSTHFSAAHLLAHLTSVTKKILSWQVRSSQRSRSQLPHRVTVKGKLSHVLG